ncbi:MAG: hypothetical protein ABR555_16305 [Pyrinomonadaceae bacterium]
MTLPVPRSYEPMEALSVPEIATGATWQYEPKWDGFSCLATKDRQKVDLKFKSGQPGSTPAHFIVFDFLVSAAGKDLITLPLSQRRQKLEQFVRKFLLKSKLIELSPATTSIASTRN